MNNDNNKNNPVQKICLFAAFCLLTFLIVSAAAGILQRKDSDRKYADFMENADKVDVIFLGSSHMLNSVSPAQLFDETGITSYNFAKPGGIIPESYWTYRLARQYVKPKCVVMDLWSLDRDYHFVDIMNGPEDKKQADNSVSLLHTNMDIWPLNSLKAEAINDLISSFDRRMEFYFDFSLYHGRWNGLIKDDFVKDAQFGDSDYLLGAEANRRMITNYNMFEPEDKSGNFEEETESIRYLGKLISECQSENIDVVLTFMPMGGSYYEDYQAINFGKKIAQKYDIEFIDLLEENGDVVNIEFDMSDDSHVNEFGMSRITTYLGKILSEHDNLADHRGEDGYGLYEEAADFLKEYRNEMLLDEEDLYMTLGYLDMNKCNFALLIRGNAAAFKDDIIIAMTERLSGSRKAYEAGNLGGPYFLLKQYIDGQETVFERAGESQDGGIETLKGPGEYIGFSNFNAFYFNGNYDENLFDMEERYRCDVQIIVFDDEGEIISEKYFDRHFTTVQE